MNPELYNTAKLFIFGVVGVWFMFILIRQWWRWKNRQVLASYKYRNRPIYIRAESPKDNTLLIRKKKEEMMLKTAGNEMGFNGEPVPVHIYPYQPTSKVNEVGDHDNYEHYHICFGEFVKENLADFNAKIKRKSFDKFMEYGLEQAPAQNQNNYGRT